ncbi:MAG: O-antigen ligase family protein [Vicinamibacterales bacterium]
MGLAPRAAVVSAVPLTRARNVEHIAPAGVLLLASASALEVALPRVGAAGLQLSSLELVAACVLATGLGALAARDGLGVEPGPLAAPVLAGLVIAVAAALLAPADVANALRYCGRLAAAALIAWLTLRSIASRRLARALVAVLLATGAAAGAVAVAELAEVPAVMRALTLVRPGFHVVGGQVRATSTFLYPTVASMYLEVVFALGLWWVVDPPDRSRPGIVRLAPMVALGLVAAGIVATFTRAGLIAMTVSLALVAALARHRRLGAPVLGRLAALAGVVVALMAGSRSPDVWLSRVSTDTAQDWYGARYSVPARLTLAAGGVDHVPVTVTNTGRLAWQSERDPVFAMSYHWLEAGTDLVVEFEGARTPFLEPVAPGRRTTLPVAVAAPGRPGRYVLAWDLVHEGRAWLSTEGVPSPRTSVEITGVAATTAPVATHGRLPGASHRLPRLTLWEAALRIARDHPLTGIGPDNFRQSYGAYLGFAAWDRRVHANNMYLEALTGAGAFGLAAVVWLVWAGLSHVWRAWRRAPADALAAPMLAAGVVIAGHGLVDSFLGFTPTYVVFAIAAGLACSPALDAPRLPHAHRV